MLPGKTHYYIFISGTALLVVSLLFSQFMLSISILLLSANWVLECFPFANNKHKALEKWKLIKGRKAIWLLVSIYFIHVFWLFNTTDFEYAFNDLKVKLPLLALPIIYGGSAKLNKPAFRNLLLLFIGAVFASSLITTYILIGFSKFDYIDFRYASLFISHIRFSLLVVLSIYSLFYLAFFSDIQSARRLKICYVILIAWFICFLILLQSFTGIFIFLLLLPFSFIWFSYHNGSKKAIKTSYSISVLLVVMIVLYGVSSICRYNRKHIDYAIHLPEKTINNNTYMHQPDLEEYENGYKIWVLISEVELQREWNKRSSYDYLDRDRKGQHIRTTIIRYMTSKGLSKDSMGIYKLTEKDIEMIEKGYTNHLYKNRFALYPRIYELMWEVEKYRQTGNPSGQSLGQRLEYLKTGMHIIKRFFWFGTGTGDIAQEFYNQYRIDKSLLNFEWQHRTHNQLLTFLITFGIFGFLWILYAIFAPPFFEKRYSHFLFVTFFLIALLSMLNEDTLESYIGVTFFSFFYSFFLFSFPHDKT